VTEYNPYPGRLDALSTVSEGRRVRIADVQGGKTMLRQMVVLGLIDGVDVMVVRRFLDGSVVVAHGNNRFRLKAGVAARIRVAAQ
jgi:Fe2+ transport system protein FeoA